MVELFSVKNQLGYAMRSDIEELFLPLGAVGIDTRMLQILRLYIQLVAVRIFPDLCVVNAGRKAQPLSIFIH